MTSPSRLNEIGPHEAAQSEVWQSGRMRRAPTPVRPAGLRGFESHRLRRFRRALGSLLRSPAPLFATASPSREKGGSCVASSQPVKG